MVFIKCGIKQGIYSEWTLLRNKDLGNVYLTADNNENLKRFTHVKGIEKKQMLFFCQTEVISQYLIFKIKSQLFHFYKHFWKWLICSNQFKTQFPLRWFTALSPIILTVFLWHWCNSVKEATLGYTYPFTKGRRMHVTN